MAIDRLGSGNSLAIQVSSVAALNMTVCTVQVSLPHYTDPEFNVDSIRRYKMYLHLKRKHPKTFLVPCYDMDLAWHAHQVHPQDYQVSLSTKLCGSLRKSIAKSR